MIGFVAVFGMLIVLALGMFTLRFYRALTQGYMGNAEVISVVYNRHGATNNSTRLRMGLRAEDGESSHPVRS